MPSKSQAQHGFMGMVRAYKAGKLDTKGLSAGLLKKIKQTASTMTDEQLSDFTKTKSSKLPQHVGERGTRRRMRKAHS